MRGRVSRCRASAPCRRGEGEFAVAVYGCLRNPEPEGLVICLRYGSGEFPPPLRQNQFVGCGEPVPPDGGFFIPGAGDGSAQVNIDGQLERKAAGAQGLQLSVADEEEFVSRLVFETVRQHERDRRRRDSGGLGRHVAVAAQGDGVALKESLPFDGHLQALAYVQGGGDHHARDEAFVGSVHLLVAIVAAGQSDRQGDEQQPGE